MSSSEGPPTTDLRHPTVDDICEQIADVGRKANTLIDGIREQRDTALDTLRAIKDCLEFREDGRQVQVIAGKGDQFWELLGGLYRSDV
jgi:hypothetical protein